jgi:excisionase family DNA binding protein
MEKLLTLDEVADYVRLNRETILRKVRTGDIPTIKIGYRSYRFDKKAIDGWLIQKTTKEPPQPNAKGNRLNLLTFHGGAIKGGLSRRDIYAGR